MKPSHTDLIDLSQASVTRLLHPDRRQTTVADLFRDEQLRGHFHRPRTATAVTLSAKAMPGHLGIRGGRLTFSFALRGQQLRNGQILIVLFRLPDSEYYFQSRVTKVYATECELEAVPARFFERTTVDCAAGVWLVPAAEVEALTVGKRVIRRLFAQDDPLSGLSYFVRDLFAAPPPKAWSLPRTSWPITTGKLVDISRGGACVQMLRQPEWNGALLYVESTLNFGRRPQNLGAFLVPQSIKETLAGLSVRGAFFSPLPPLSSGIKGATRTFTFDFGELVKFTLDGVFYEADGVIDLELPFGSHILNVLWSDQATSRRVIVIAPETDRTIAVTQPGLSSAS